MGKVNIFFYAAALTIYAWIFKFINSLSIWEYSVRNLLFLIMISKLVSIHSFATYPIPFPSEQQALREFLAAQDELKACYENQLTTVSDIHEHLPLLRQLASESSSVVEIGMRTMCSSWAILQGLADSFANDPSYLGIDITLPPIDTLEKAKSLAAQSGIKFLFSMANDLHLMIPETDFLFIDSLHTYCHLTYELETFSPKVNKYIAMHDSSAPWGYKDDGAYTGDYSEYPESIDRSKRGLWPAIEDFLQRHPEWKLVSRHYNCHGFTILSRVEPK